MYSGLAQIRGDRRVQRELRQARSQWIRLKSAAQSCSEHGESFTRELKKRGYRDYFVRRWIIARLQPVAAVVPSDDKQ